MNQHQNYYLDLGMGHWLKYVDHLTFPTTSVPLSPEDATNIRTCYAHLHTGMKSATLSPPLLSIVTGLAERLAPAIEAMASSNGFVFAKLSGRSAKDAPLHTQKLDALLASKVQGHEATDDNARLVSLFDSALDIMRVSDAAHLVWLLINSQRVDEDLDVALKYPERWDQAVVVRTWWPGVSTDLEFRMFVVGGEPTGATQYNNLICTQRVAKRGPAIAKALRAYYDRKVRPCLEGTEFFSLVRGRFTCDLALHPEALALIDELVKEGSDREAVLAVLLDEEKVLVTLVELNCFCARPPSPSNVDTLTYITTHAAPQYLSLCAHLSWPTLPDPYPRVSVSGGAFPDEATGMGLFDFYKDAEVLNNGPFEFRVRTESLPHVAVKLEAEWRAVLQNDSNAARTRRAHMRDAAWAQIVEAGGA